MPQIDFYLLPYDHEDAIHAFIARLVEKAFNSDHKIFIYTDQVEQARHLDERLWCFRAESFLPHERVNQNAPSPATAINLSEVQAPDALPKDLLINLNNDIPDSFIQYQRVIEIVSQQPAQKQRAREHFKQYKAQGFTPSTHEINNTVAT